MKQKHQLINMLCRGVACLWLLTLPPVGVVLSSKPVEAQPLAYVTNSEGFNVSVIDIGTNSVVATVPVGGFSTGVAITPDGTRAYVTILTSFIVSVIDIGTNSVVATVPVGGFPFGVAITPDGTRAYVTNSGSNNVSVIDIGTNSVVATVPVGLGPFGVAITPDGTRAYVTNSESFNVSVIDIGTNSVVATVPVGGFSTGVAITPDGTRAYVTNSGSNNVSVIDIGTNSVVATVPVGLGPFGVAITPDGTRAYVTNGGSSNVSVIDIGTNSVVATVPAGSFPVGVAITPDGTRAYVANISSFNDGNVSVIDIGTNSVVATVLAGRGPFGVAITLGVTVQAAEATQDQVDVLQNIVDTNPGTPLADKIQDVIAKLQTALDELNKEPPDNQAAAGNIEGAVGDLEAVVNDGLLDPTQGAQLMDQLAGIARQVATDALDEAIAQSGDPGEINDAQQALNEGDGLRTSEAFKDAVNKYKDALSKAESAQPPAAKPVAIRVFHPTDPSIPDDLTIYDLLGLEGLWLLDPELVDGLNAHGNAIEQATVQTLQFELEQNHPNPFNPATTIHYALSEATQVRLTIYNVLGQPVRVLVNGGQGAGVYSVNWDGRDSFGKAVASGVYLYRLKAGANVSVRKMILAK